MKTVYVAHSTRFDYENELYRPLRTIEDGELRFIFPYETTREPLPTKDIIKNCSGVLADVSLQATGMGIELGWADMYGKPIAVIFKRGTKITKSLGFVTNRFLEYEDLGDILQELRELLLQA
jgi:hypothetical protein